VAESSHMNTINLIHYQGISIPVPYTYQTRFSLYKLTDEMIPFM
jgi:hypothetical protein